MAYVPNHEHDIFVSYAHVDDEPLPGADEGWVTTLMQGLNKGLAQKLGRKDAFSLWDDKQLARNVEFTPQIMNALEKSAVLLVVLSPGYVASEWCQREKETFLKEAKERVCSGSRVFVVERDMVEEFDRPDAFKELKGYRFWVVEREGGAPRTLGTPKPSAQDTRYYDSLNLLCHDLAKELRRLKEITANTEQVLPAADTRPRVFLAEVTDDLDFQRDEIISYLDQAGVLVLPEAWYSREPAAFQRALEKDLARCQLFVQLLSGVPGKKSPDLPKGYIALQYECAKKTNKTIMQWRSPELDLSTVRDPDHRALLELASTDGIEEFKREVRERAVSKPPATPKKSMNAFVFVDMDRSDRSIADAVCQVLERYGAGYVLPMQNGSPSEIREDLTQNLLECDALIVIYGDTTVTWVREQLRQCHKILSQRETPLKAFALYEGSNQATTEGLGLKLAGMNIIDCRDGLHETDLKAFLDRIDAEESV